MVIKYEDKKIEVSDYVVVNWIKDAVCDYFKISRGTLGDPTRAATSSYPRKVFWYVARRLYLLELKLLQEIADHEFNHTAIIIQSETLKLQIIHDMEKRVDVEEVLKLVNEAQSKYFNK